MTLLQKRALFMLILSLLFGCFFLLFPWPIALVILIILSIFLSGAAAKLWPKNIPVSQEEYSSYDLGLREVVYYQPSDQPKEAPVTEDVPAAQYPEMQQYR